MNWLNRLTKWNRPKPSIPNHGTLTTDLKEMLSAHHLPNIVEHEDWLLVNGNLPGLRADYSIMDSTPDRCMVGVDFKLAIKEGRHIIESYGDIGTDFRQASGKNLFKFCVGTLHVFLSAYWNHHEADQVDIEHWNTDVFQWQVYLSSVINTTSEGQKAGLPTNYNPLLKEAICALPLSEAEHWVSVFFSNLKNEWTTEVRLDNDIHADLTDGVSHMNWPEAEGFYSQRQFILLKRIDTPTD